MGAVCPVLLPAFLCHQLGRHLFQGQRHRLSATEDGILRGFERELEECELAEYMQEELGKSRPGPLLVAHSNKPVR